MVKAQAAERQRLKEAQQARWQAETKQRQERFNKWVRGLLDRVTGRRRQLKQQNEMEALQAMQRDRQEKDRLVFQHLEHRRTSDACKERLEVFREERQQDLRQDRQQYQEIREKKRTMAEFKQAVQPKRPSTAANKKRSVSDFREAMRTRNSRRGPERER